MLMRSEEKVSTLLAAVTAVSGAMVGLIMVRVMGLPAAAFTLAPISLVLAIALIDEDGKPVGSLVDRLIEAMDFGTGGAESFYRAVSIVILRRACELGEEPKSMDELVARLDYLDLVEALKPEQMAGITAKNVDAVRIRCEALPDRVADRLFKGPGKSPEPEADPASPKTIAKPRP